VATKPGAENATQFVPTPELPIGTNIRLRGRKEEFTVTGRTESQVAKLAQRRGNRRELYGIDWIYATKEGAKTGKVLNIKDIV
jgi:hypothetical protein